MVYPLLFCPMASTLKLKSKLTFCFNCKVTKSTSRVLWILLSVFLNFIYVWQNPLFVSPTVCLSVGDLCPSVFILCLFYLSLHFISITQLSVLLLCICVFLWVYLNIISPVCQSVFGICPFLRSAAFIFPSVCHSFPACFGYLFYLWYILSSRMQERKDEFPMIWQYQ